MPWKERVYLPHCVSFESSPRGALEHIEDFSCFFLFGRGNRPVQDSASIVPREPQSGVSEMLVWHRMVS